jgi:hypothetical protein
MNIILGIGSVFVGIIKSVDTYFQLAKRAESHRICSLQFSQIYKKIQIELSLNRSQRVSAENMMNIVKTDIKNMQDIAPLIDDDIVVQYNEKYRKYKKVKKPNFVNGLTEVKINSAEDDIDYASRQGSREPSPERSTTDPNNLTMNNEDAISIENDENRSTTSVSQKIVNIQPPQLDTRIPIQSNHVTPTHSIPNTPSNRSATGSVHSSTSHNSNSQGVSGLIRVDANGTSTLSA